MGDKLASRQHCNGMELFQTTYSHTLIWAMDMKWLVGVSVLHVLSLVNAVSNVWCRNVANQKVDW